MPDDKTNFVFPDDDKIRDFVVTLDEQYAELARLRDEYMQACKMPRELIRDVFDDAFDAGIPKRSLKRAYNRKLLRAKLESERMALEDEPELQEDMDKIESAILAFETTPLGRAARKTKAA